MSLRLKSLGAAGNDSNFESSVDNIAKHLIICMFCKLIKNIFPFSEIIFVLLQADLHDLNGVQTLANQIWKP